MKTITKLFVTSALLLAFSMNAKADLKIEMSAGWRGSGGKGNTKGKEKGSQPSRIPERVLLPMDISISDNNCRILVVGQTNCMLPYIIYDSNGTPFLNGYCSCCENVPGVIDISSLPIDEYVLCIGYNGYVFCGWFEKY